MTDKELIKQEIERRINLIQDTKVTSYADGWIQAYKELLQFINSLPEESANDDLENQYKSNMRYQHAYTQDDLMKTESEGLEEYAKKLAKGAALDKHNLIYMCKKGAEWQRKQDRETIELAEDHALLAGMMKEREEMMKDAVDGEVMYSFGTALEKQYKVTSERIKMDGLKLGDRVKIIIIKPEQQ